MKFIRKPFQHFFQLESSSSILLFAATVLALLLANSGWADGYEAFWQQKLTIGFPDFNLSKALLLWINDGLMAVFFFLIGMEIKREIFVGELSEPRKAVLPVVAAIGGMIFPVIVFFLFHGDNPGEEGWAIPMATDIAFTLGILKILGKRVPLGLKIFLTAYAIIDDLGAVVIIALFYSAEIYWQYIGWGMGIIVALLAVGRTGFYSKYIYLPLGVVTWVLFLKSGLHPTIAGVLMGFTIPLQRKIDIINFIDQLQEAVAGLTKSGTPPYTLLTNEQIGAVDAIESAVEDLQSPLQQLEHRLHGWVAYVIIPLFALANAGVQLTGKLEGSLSGLAFSIAFSMVVGKVIGISLSSYLSVRLGWAQLPNKVNFRQVIGVGFLGGLGFTMALFIANLSFAAVTFANAAKIGILAGSVVAGLLGFLFLRWGLAQKEIQA